MTIPDYQSLMLPVLSASSKGEVRIGDAVDGLAEQLGLTPEERAELLPSGKQTLFGNRVHWAKTYIAKAGLIENTRRGHFKITQRGQLVLDAHPARIDNAFLASSTNFSNSRKGLARHRPRHQRKQGQQKQSSAARRRRRTKLCG